MAAAAQSQDTTAIRRTATVIPDALVGSCAGEIISDIEFQTGRPPFGGISAVWRATARMVGMHHQTTRTSVIAAFLQVHVGQPCTDRGRQESERVLRAQPFIATARVRAIPDSASPGHVLVIVQTTDEIPIIVGARISRHTLSRFSFGNSNLGGLGVAAQGELERGFAYRTGFGARIDDYAVGFMPIRATIAGERDPLGSSWELGVSHPFFTDLQSTSWRGSVYGLHEFFPIARPANDGLALQIDRTNWEVGALSRLRFLGRLALGGLVLSGTRVSPSDQGVVISDTGLLADTGRTLSNRYAGFHSVRLGAVVGLRALGFRPVRGFDALNGTQDIAVGVQAGVLAARGIGSFGESDYYFATDVYAGFGNDEMFAAVQVDADIHRSLDAHRWDDFITSGRAAWYTRRGRYTLVVSDEFAAGWRTRLPIQLPLGGSGSGTNGGVRGYSGALLAGATRNVLRIEQRRFVSKMFSKLDLGVAAFADVGAVWSGDAPYGQTTAPRPSLGVSLLGAYPSGSKRLYRVDLAVPVGKGARHSVAVRFVTDVHALVFWQEPGDVSRSRTGGTPARLFNWPSR